ncbi:MAG: tyrosine-type recombinase/integrase [Bacteroidetes bacterium]|nr:tyrosine-type recombinase/integrase [Bacteroidota bacterium]MBU1719136.1 tyrosine-type recombinase/integrase [Bacteroidota bacterium]
MKQSLGYVSLRTEWVFLEFDKFFLGKNITVLGITKEQVDQWRATRINDASATIYTKYSILSQFCRYMCKNGYDSFIPRMPVNTAKNSFTPYIFSNSEMAAIFSSCDNLRLYDRHMTTIQFIIPAIVRLLYGTGLRISEALSLKNWDVDLDRRIIRIRKAKNGEERLAPLSDTLTVVLKQYLHYRDQMPVPHIGDANNFFFVSSNGSYCRSGSVYNWFRKVLSESGIPHQGNHKGPRVHDLRHSFAVHSLVKMANSGMDIYYSMPFLSTFLGHKSLGATEYYVRLTTEMHPSLLADQKSIGTYVFPKSNNLMFYGND